jgi:hypothetical protein
MVERRRMDSIWTTVNLERELGLFDS